ncbi:MAG: hypothetical protein RIN55_08605 [Tissierellaceae bacterium]|nr:hypothetical protein [Tissierellaceae bacterium]
MKIKLKMKTIIAITISMIFIFVVAGPFITYEIAYILNSKGSAKAGIFYDAYFSYPIKFNEDRALYEMANHLTGGLYKYKLFTQMQGSNSDVSPDDMIKSKEALERILYEFKDSEYYFAAYSKIMDLHLASQDAYGLRQWIEWGKTQEDLELVYTSDLYKSYCLFANRDYAGANQILEIYNSDEVDSRYDYLMGNILAFTGNEELARKHFDKAVEKNDYNYTLFGSPIPDRRNEWYSEYVTGLKGEYKIRGTVSFDGEPMPFVEIYVQKEGSGYNVGYTDLIGITDINGEFETLGLRSGRYDIGIGINPSIAYNKVYLRKNIWVLELNNDTRFDFELASPMEILSPGIGTVVENSKFTVSWEPVNGAEHYQIQTVNFYNPTNTGVFRTTIRDSKGNINIKETSTEIDIRKASRFVDVMGYDGDDDNELRVLPTSILGSFFHGSEYSIMVNAFDSEGNMVGSSIPLIKFYDELSTVKIKGQISKGENFIQKWEYEKAIDHYEEILEKDPENEEALIYLSKIYAFGWENRQEYIKTAIEYANRYMEAYDDGSLLLVVVGNMSKDSKLEYSDLIDKAFEIIPIEERGSMYYTELGRYKSLLEDYEGARDAYDVTENHIPIYVFYMDLYLEDLDKALERIDDFRLTFVRMSKETLRHNITGLNKEVLESADYIKFKDFLYNIISGNLSREERRELISNTIKSIDNKNIKEILQQIRLEE